MRTGLSPGKNWHILELEIPNLLESGYVFIRVTTLSFFWWPVINQFLSMGFELVEETVWLKYSKKSKLYQSTWNWWLRAKESCLMFKKNCFAPLSSKGDKDILACLRRAPSPLNKESNHPKETLTKINSLKRMKQTIFEGNPGERPAKKYKGQLRL